MPWVVLGCRGLISSTGNFPPCFLRTNSYSLAFRLNWHTFQRITDNSPQRQLAPNKTRPKTSRPTFRRQLAPFRRQLAPFSRLLAPHSQGNSPLSLRVAGTYKISDQVLHKQSYTATKDGKRLEALYLRSRWILLSIYITKQNHCRFSHDTAHMLLLLV